jgi:Mce-associated membrane protein
VAVDADTSDNAVDTAPADERETFEASAQAEGESTDDSDTSRADSQSAARDDTGPPAPKAGRTGMRAGVITVAIVLAALVGLGSWLGQQIVKDRRAEAQRQMLVAAGRQAALNLTTIDYTTVDTDITRILDSSKGTFHDDFQNRSAPFIEAVTESKSKSEGTVTEAGLESQDGDEAQVLVAVAVKTSTAGVAEPQPRAWRMRITVAHNADHDAKVSNVQFVP